MPTFDPMFVSTYGGRHPERDKAKTLIAKNVTPGTLPRRFTG